MRNPISILVLFFVAFIFQSCDFLDIVPKNNPSYTSVFRSRDGARKALHGLYSYMPNHNSPVATVASATDGLSFPPGYGSGYWTQKQMWANNFSASSPGFDYWSDEGAHSLNLYTGIRYCFSFLNNIDNVPDISASDSREWKAQANFLIGYYYFLLLKNYGPVPLIDKVKPFTSKELPKRASVDSTVAFILKYIDRGISGLPQTYKPNSLGKPTSVAAKAIKAKVLVFAASPLFNGEAPNRFESLTGSNGKHLFPQNPDPSKWEKALRATTVAIDAAHNAGNRLYYYIGNKPEAWDTWTKEDQAVATNIFKITKKWNDELIWGNSTFIYYGWQNFSYRTCISPVHALNSAEVTIEAVERFYTKDGLPIDVDPNYDYADRYSVMGVDSTAYLNRDRSPRYYATVAFDRGKYYMNGETLDVRTREGDLQGIIHNINDGGSTGYFIQKFTSPNSVINCNTVNIQYYPFPIIRLAGLYLLNAEAFNEVNGDLSGDALTYFNDVRDRAGIPTLQQSWALVGGVPNSKEKLRQIIHRERYNELAFEGDWYYDLRRWVVAEKHLDHPVHGWNVTSNTQSGFYQLQSTYENVDRKFNDRFYFLPIPLTVININPNLVQNPGY